eukprot:765235-Hanusia_phi.AAC.3
MLLRKKRAEVFKNRRIVGFVKFWSRSDMSADDTSLSPAVGEGNVEGSEDSSAKTSQRADGSLRKEVRVRKGYVPPSEDVEVELSREYKKHKPDIDEQQTDSEDTKTTENATNYTISSWDEYFQAFGSSEIRKCRQYVVHACSVGSNAVNEDSYAIGEDSVFAVFDGHGGPDCSRWMANNVIPEFDKNCPLKGSGNDLDSIEEMFFSSTKKPKEKEAEKKETRRFLKKLFAHLDTRYMSTTGSQNPFCGSCGLHKDDELAQKADPSLDCKKRVAGTLMVTRALGDGFLKDPNVCPDNMKDNMPYITSKPKVKEIVKDYNDSFLVIASDGVWDILDDNDVALEIMNACKSVRESKKTDSGGEPTNLATAVAKAVIQEMMTRRYVLLAELSQMKASERRHYIDDVTVLVVDLRA